MKIGVLITGVLITFVAALISIIGLFSGGSIGGPGTYTADDGITYITSPEYELDYLELCKRGKEKPSLLVKRDTVIAIPNGKEKECQRTDMAALLLKTNLMYRNGIRKLYK